VSQSIRRWRGLVALVADAVEQGASAVERIHLASAEMPFRILKQVPGVSPGAALVEHAFNGCVAGTYASVRAVTRVVAGTVDFALEAVDKEAAPLDEQAPPEGPSGARD